MFQKVLAALVAALTLFSAGAVASNSPKGTGALDVSHVHISGFAFSPTPLTVAAGTTIEWDNHDGAPHTATADDGRWGSPTLSQGESWSRAFDAPGTFAYHCEVHPSMTGTIEVTGGAAPTVAIDAPAAGAIVSGAITARGTSSAPGGAVVRVDVAVDDGAFAAASGTTAWTFALDTMTLSDGGHTLRARAFDGASFSSVASVAFTVQNGVNAAPTIAIAFPAAGATLRGTSTFAGSAADADGAVVRVEFAIDDGAFAVASGTTSWSASVDTRALANGAHTFRARAFDGEAFSAEATLAFRVENLADLAVREGEFTTVQYVGRQDLSAVVRNLGTAGAGAFEVSFFYEYHGTLRPIATRTVDGLGEGASATVTASWSTLGKVGRFPIVVVVDGPDAVAETNEENNRRSATAVVLVNVPGVDAFEP